MNTRPKLNVGKMSLSSLHSNKKIIGNDKFPKGKANMANPRECYNRFT